jgi:hypothetical protein
MQRHICNAASAEFLLHLSITWCMVTSILALHAPVVLPSGLSETFIMMDDDFFLTEPWTLSDFITPDRGQTMTGRG